MKRTALIAGVSLASLLVAGPVWALPGDLNVWSGGFNITSPEPAAPPKASRQRLRGDHAAKKSEPADKTPIPSGQLAVIVSIDKQRATLFADGHPVASTAVSTGTREHPTPMGVFSVIQKDRHHVSNLYNASMPYMQRITWSGSALHEGPLPGYPASHGCVRLTTSFAQYLWRTTKMGARVIITHPDVAPTEFEHAKLFVPKPRVAQVTPSVVPAAAPVAAAPATAPAVAPGPAPKADLIEPPATSTVTRVRTADASNATAILSLVGDAAKPVVTSVETQPLANRAAPEQTTKLSVELRADQAEAKPAATADEKPVETTAAESVGEKPVEAPVTVAQPAEAPPALATAPAATETTAVETAPVQPKAAEAKPAEAKPMTIAAPPSIIVDERPKSMPVAVVQEANGRPISVFVSLKAGKLYVRQGWKPLFEAPVSFENPDQPIGTHVYTAMGVKDGGPALRWTVISIPSGYRHVAELHAHGRKLRSEQPVKVADVTPAAPPSPSSALDRIIMPPELVERVSEMITPGSSLIVSDNRLSDETGEYTDFIVLTH